MINITNIVIDIKCYYSALSMDLYEIACFSPLVFPDGSEGFRSVLVVNWELGESVLTLGRWESVRIQMFLRNVANSL